VIWAAGLVLEAGDGFPPLVLTNSAINPAEAATRVPSAVKAPVRLDQNDSRRATVKSLEQDHFAFSLRAIAVKRKPLIPGRP
jgi:hypothetical protein